MIMVLPIYYSQYPCESFHLSSSWTSLTLSYSFLVFTDYGIYWVHRTLHHPSIYKHVHKPHHKWLSMSRLFLRSPFLTPIHSPNSLRITCLSSPRRLPAIRALSFIHLHFSVASLALSWSFRVCKLLEYFCEFLLLSFDVSILMRGNRFTTRI